MQTYRDLVVWQKAIAVTTEVYSVTQKFPDAELYGPTSQMRRASVSIASNIAEGKLRGSKIEWIRFLRIAFGSGGELETQIEIAKRLPRMNRLDYSKLEAKLNEVMRMLNAMISKANA